MADHVEPTTTSSVPSAGWRLTDDYGDEVVVLRPWRISDSNTLFAIYQDPAVIAAINPDQDKRVDSAQTAFEMIMVARQRAARGEGIGIAICRRTDEVMVGIVELDAFSDKPDEAEVSFAVIDDQRRHGYGGRAVNLVCEWALQDLGLKAIWAVVDVVNQPSRRTLDRTAFGETRRAWPQGLRKHSTSLVLARESPGE